MGDGDWRGGDGGGAGRAPGSGRRGVAGADAGGAAYNPARAAGRFASELRSDSEKGRREDQVDDAGARNPEPRPGICAVAWGLWVSRWAEASRVESGGG